MYVCNVHVPVPEHLHVPQSGVEPFVVTLCLSTCIFSTCSSNSGKPTACNTTTELDTESSGDKQGVQESCRVCVFS